MDNSQRNVLHKCKVSLEKKTPITSLVATTTCTMIVMSSVLVAYCAVFNRTRYKEICSRRLFDAHLHKAEHKQSVFFKFINAKYAQTMNVLNVRTRIVRAFIESGVLTPL